ncbi:MAG: RNA-binding protein [Jatrophihabitans sp.]|uniref:RNA-binding protein n=1 Tax=Jatrophihabitans sp. TaxID=1932789 RepID=UPI00391321A9
MLEEALEHLVRGIVDHPDDVQVDMIDNRRGQRLEIRVHPDDLGRVIGRNGRTAKALRQVIKGVGDGVGARGIRVDVVDVDRR